MKKSKVHIIIINTYLMMLRICKSVYKHPNQRIRMKILPEKLKRILPKDLKRKFVRRLKNLNNNEVKKKCNLELKDIRI
jgi:hypothetical protein